MVYEICVVVLTIAFLIFVIWVIITLKKVWTFLDHFDNHLTLLNHDVLGLLQNTQDLTKDLKGKLEKIDPVFRIVEICSEDAEDSYSRMRSRNFANFSSFRARSDELTDKVMKFLDLATLVVSLWQRKKK